jgi:hypothetical protein
MTPPPATTTRWVNHSKHHRQNSKGRFGVQDASDRTSVPPRLRCESIRWPVRSRRSWKDSRTGPSISLRHPPVRRPVRPRNPPSIGGVQGLSGDGALRQRLEFTPITAGIGFRRWLAQRYLQTVADPDPKSGSPPLGATRRKTSSAGPMNEKPTASRQGGRIKRPS